jgi:ferredoxin
MKISVDLKLCEGNAKCMAVAPEVFEVGEDEKSHVRVESPGARLRDKVMAAARLCPRQAITVSE